LYLEKDKKEMAMEINGNYSIDEKGRLVRKVVLNGKNRRYYVGNNIQGFIEVDAGGEYVVVQNEKRYWRGISVPFPDKLLLLKDFNLCIFKPDSVERGLVKDIRSIITNSFEILVERLLTLDQQMIFRLYPYFFEKSWEDNLLKYMTSGMSHCLLVSGADIFRELPRIRNYIRFKYESKESQHPIVNLVHCADNKENAIRESLVFFKQEELAAMVGFFE